MARGIGRVMRQGARVKVIAIAVNLPRTFRLNEGAGGRIVEHPQIILTLGAKTDLGRNSLH